MIKGLWFAAVLAVVAPAGSAVAATCRGVEFADSVEVDGRALALNGLGLRLATLLEVKVYVAALYVVEPSRDATRVLEAGPPKRLVLHFLRDVDADDLNAAWDEGFARNAPDRVPALGAQLARLKAWMTDLRAGQQLVLTQRVDGAVEVEVAGRRAGSLDGEGLAAALFSLWLGPRPPNPALKAGLLGGGCD